MKIYANKKEDIVNDVIGIYKQYNLISKKFYYKKGKYSLKSIDDLFGDFMNVIKEINNENISINHDINIKQDLINDILNLYSKHGFIDYKLYYKEGKFNYKYIIDTFGSFKNMKNELSINNKKYIEKTKDEILTLGKEYFNEFGYIKKMDFIKNKNISYTDFNNKFSSYKEFLDLLNVKNEINKNRNEKISNKLKGNNNFKKQLKLNKEEVEKIILNTYNNKGYNDFTMNYLVNNSILYDSIIKKYYKTFSNMKKELKLYNNKEYFLLHRYELDKYLLKIYNKYKKLTRDVIKKNSVYPYKLIINIYGSHQKMLEKLNIKKLPSQVKNISTKELLDDLYNLYITYNEISEKIINDYGKYNTKMYFSKVGNMKQIYNSLNILKYNTNPSISSIAIYAISIISDILSSKPEIEKTFYWLINPKTNNNLKLDAYFNNYKLAIEYDGIQHYQHIPYLDKYYNDFINRQYKDRVKEKLCKENKIKLIRIKYDEPLTKEYIINKLMENDIIF